MSKSECGEYINASHNGTSYKYLYSFCLLRGIFGKIICKFVCRDDFQAGIT